MPVFSVSENDLDVPGAMFSTSPMIRLPFSTSHSVTRAPPAFVTSKVVAPAGSFSEAGLQPSSLSEIATLRPPSPDEVPPPDDPQPAATAATRPTTPIAIVAVGATAARRQRAGHRT